MASRRQRRVIGGNRGIGREIAQHYADAGRRGRHHLPRRRGRAEEAAAEIGGSTPRHRARPDQAERPSRHALSSVGPVRYLVIAAIEPRRKPGQRLRHRARDGASSRSSSSATPRSSTSLLDRLGDDSRHRPLRRPGQGPPVPRLDDGLDRQRRHRRARPHAGRRAGADPRQRHPPRRRGGQPVLVGQEIWTSSDPARRPGG